MRNRKRITLTLIVLLARMTCAGSLPVMWWGCAWAQTKLPPSLAGKLEKKISLDLRDMNVVDVYKFLAVKGEFNISISKNIAGRVTLYLNDVTVKDALDIISIANNLGYKTVGENIIHVMTESEYMAIYGKKFSDKTNVHITYLKYAKPAYVLEALKNIKSEIGKIVIDEDTGSVVMIDTEENMRLMEQAITKMDHPLEMRLYNLQYANAEDVAQKLKQKLDSKAVGTVQGDARSNQLVVRALPDRLEEVDEIIKALDKKTRAVMIDVRIIKLTMNPKYDQGIDWESVFTYGPNAITRQLNLVGSFPISSTVSTAATIGTVGQIAVGNILDDDFAMTLKLLDQVSDTKILASPSLMVLHNKEARIHVGDKLAYVTTTTIGTGESQRVNEQIHYIDVGVQFKVTPTINEDGFITMAIQPEISSESGTLETPQGAEVPLINSTLVETNVIVKDETTIIIAGLRQDEIQNTKKGIPFLMDIPVVGNAFSNISEETKQTEIVILLTPHIVSGDENMIDEQIRERRTIKPDKIY